MPGGIRVIIHDDFRHVPSHNGDLLLGQAGAAGGDHILNSGLVKAQAIKVAFHDDQSSSFLCGFAREMQRIQNAGFRIQRRFCGIQILGLGFGGQRTSTERNGFAPLIPYWKHQTAAKPFVDISPIVLDEKTATYRILEPEARHQAGCRSIAKIEAVGKSRLNLPFLQHLPRFHSFLGGQHLTEVG